MITVFGRNYYGATGCNYSGASAEFDGINDYATGNTNNHWPAIYATNSQNQIILSQWVKSDYATTPNGLKFILGQTAATLGNGNSTNQFFRLAYQFKTNTGVNRNRMVVTYRDSGTTNIMEKQYELHSNTAITGASSVTDFWTAGNTNIIKNVNDFVHLCVILDIPPIGQPYGVAGDIKLYWNGQLLTNTVVNTKSGVATNSQTSVYGILGTNAANLSGHFHGKVDEMIALPEGFVGALSSFKTAYSLSTDQDVVDFLWNSGCPSDLVSHPNSSSWDYYNYRFENNWNSEAANPFPFTPVNGATFSTEHA